MTLIIKNALSFGVVIAGGIFCLHLLGLLFYMEGEGFSVAPEDVWILNTVVGYHFIIFIATSVYWYIQRRRRDASVHG